MSRTVAAPPDELVARARRAPDPRVVGLAVAGLGAWLAAARDFGPDGYLVPWKGLAVVLLGLAPGLAYLARLRRAPRTAGPLPYLPLFGLVFALYYGLPVLVRDRLAFMSLSPDARSVSRALDLSLVGIGALYAGFFVLGRRLVGGAAPLRVELGSRARTAALVLACVGALAVVAGESLPVPPYLRQVIHTLTLFLRVGIGVLVVLDLSGRLPRGMHRLVWWVAVPAFLFLALRSGTVGGLVRPLVFLMLLVWSHRFRLPWTLLAVALFLAVLLRGAAAEFRDRVHRSQTVAELNPFQRSLLFAEIARRGLLRDPVETVRSSFDLMGSRTAQLGLFAHVVHRTPEAVPYWGGETYGALAAGFVPRFVWRDKPTKELGQRFGHRYAVISPRDHSTSVNLPQMVEMFANFGPLGVLLGMAALGVLYRWAQAKLDRFGAGEGTTVIGAVVFSELVNLESDFSLVFGGLLQTAAVLWLALRLFSAPGERARPRPRALESAPSAP